MNEEQAKQPVDGGGCDVCGSLDWQKNQPGVCIGCDRRRAAAIEWLETSDEERKRSL